METNRTIAPKVMERNKSKLHLFLLFLGIMIATLVTGCDSGGIQPPVSITFRYSALDSATKVMQVTNRSGSETLVMKIDAYNDAKTQHADLIFKVAPGDTYEIGILEMGWAFEKGERYSIKADGSALTIDGKVT